MKDYWQKYLAEMFGTFTFVFIACASLLANWQSGGALGTVGIALAHGLGLTAMIYTMWHISGAHFNPAVTIACWATGHLKPLTALGYVISQLVGAVVAALFVKLIFLEASPQFYLGSTSLVSGTTPGMGIFIEGLLTFFLAMAVFGAAVDKRAASGFGGLAVGFVAAAAIMVGGGFTMASLNPARSFGPALISSHWTAHYVYWIGPIVGALAAGLVYNFGLLKKM